jgi:hypothetical protein
LPTASRPASGTTTAVPRLGPTTSTSGSPTPANRTPTNPEHNPSNQHNSKDQPLHHFQGLDPTDQHDTVPSATDGLDHGRAERIATDLQETLIRDLFGLRLSLQGVASRIASPDARAGLTASVDELDRIIRAVRTAVFAMEPLRSADNDSG